MKDVGAEVAKSLWGSTIATMYARQKLIRADFGSNNVDHCLRLRHTSSVAALLEMIGAVPCPIGSPMTDDCQAKVIIVMGARLNSNYPVAATFM